MERKCRVEDERGTPRKDPICASVKRLPIAPFLARLPCARLHWTTERAPAPKGEHPRGRKAEMFAR